MLGRTNSCLEESALQLSLTDPASKGAVNIISNIFTVTQFDSIITVSDFLKLRTRQLSTIPTFRLVIMEELGIFLVAMHP